MAKLAQASSSETFGKWGEPGNQRRTKGNVDGELNIMDVYEGFTVCMRWRDTSLAKRAAELAVGVVKNELNGYAQNNGAYPRTTLLKELRACHWDPAKIAHPNNCDCSSFMMTLMRYNDLDTITEEMWTGDQLQQMRATGAFTEIKITDNKTFKYHVGDILWKTGHTAIVIEGDEDSKKYDDYVYIWNCVSANVRAGSSVNTKTVGTVHPGDILPFLGEAANGWVKVVLGGTEGYISPKYATVMQHGYLKGNCWMRKTPNTDDKGNEIKSISGGKEVFLTGDTATSKNRLWYKAYYDGDVGWMSSLYCRPGTEEEIFGDR